MSLAWPCCSMGLMAFCSNPTDPGYSILLPKEWVMRKLKRGDEKEGERERETERETERERDRGRDREREMERERRRERDREREGGRTES